jgi:hypothetical protein
MDEGMANMCGVVKTVIVIVIVVVVLVVVVVCTLNGVVVG